MLRLKPTFVQHVPKYRSVKTRSCKSIGDLNEYNTMQSIAKKLECIEARLVNIETSLNVSGKQTEIYKRYESRKIHQRKNNSDIARLKEQIADATSEVRKKALQSKLNMMTSLLDV